MNDMAMALASEQRKRMVASILGGAEQTEWWGKLTAAEKREFRQKTLDSIGVFYDFVRDVIKVRGEEFIQSEEGLKLLRAIHAKVK